MKLSHVAKTLSHCFISMGMVLAVVSVSGSRSLSMTTGAAELVSSDRTSQINIRSNPSVEAQALHYGFAGDRVKVLKKSRGDDGSTWCYVRFEQSGAKGWVRGDFVRQGMGSSRPKPETPQKSPSISNPGDNITQAQINYFMEVAMGSEFYQDNNPKIRKWEGDVRIQPLGKPTPEDLKTVQKVISEINELAGGAIRLQLVTQNPNITLNFAPESQFRKLESAYVPINYGFFTTRWDNSGRIYKANVLITTTNVTQKERSHLIREELTQSLGLMRDSHRYSRSIFYQPWTDVTEFAEIDKALIRMLYNPNLRSGMTKAEALGVFSTLQARVRAPLKF